MARKGMGRAMILLAIDTDQTIDFAGGPVPSAEVLRLASVHEVWSIGRRELAERLGVPHVGVLVGKVIEGGRSYPGGKSAALLALRARYPSADRYVVVDDDFADYELQAPGWAQVSPDHFVQGLSEYF